MIPLKHTQGAFPDKLIFPVCAIPGIQLCRCPHLQRKHPLVLKGHCNALVSETNSCVFLGKVTDTHIVPSREYRSVYLFPVKLRFLFACTIFLWWWFCVARVTETRDKLFYQALLAAPALCHSVPPGNLCQCPKLQAHSKSQRVNK